MATALSKVRNLELSSATSFVCANDRPTFSQPLPLSCPLHHVRDSGKVHDHTNVNHNRSSGSVVEIQIGRVHVDEITGRFDRGKVGAGRALKQNKAKEKSSTNKQCHRLRHTRSPCPPHLKVIRKMCSASLGVFIALGPLETRLAHF